MMQDEVYDEYEYYGGKDDFITGVQLAYKLIKPDQSIEREFQGEVFTDLRKANLDPKEQAIIESFFKRITNIQVLMHNLNKEWHLSNLDREAERVAEEWARREAEMFFKGLAKEIADATKQKAIEDEEEINLRIGVDIQNFENLVAYYKKLFLPKARMYVMYKKAFEPFYPYYHYKMLAQKLLLSGSKKGWFLKLFRTTYRGRVEEEGGKKGLFR